MQATATTTYECVNGGGKNLSASNKTTSVTGVSNTGTFTADKNGNIVGSISVSPPTASQLGFSCPPGQTTTFVGVTYSNVSIVDNTSGATLAVPGTYSYTNPAAPAEPRRWPPPVARAAGACRRSDHPPRPPAPARPSRPDRPHRAHPRSS